MAGVLAPYAALLRTPGIRRFVAGRILAQLGGAMFGVAVVAMVASRRGSYELAGSVSAAGLVVLALSAAPLGWLVDRRGQRRVSLPVLAWSSAWLVFTVVCSFVGAPAWTLFVGYPLAAIVVSFGAMSRARWTHLLAGDESALHTAMSMEQVIDETSFAVGPVIAVVAAVLMPELGVLLAGAAYLVGGLVFLSSRWTEPPPVAQEERPAGLAVLNPSLLVLTAALTLVGVVFGANEVTTIALADHAGQSWAAGPVLGMFAVGSALAGLVFGTRHVGAPLSRQLWIGALGMAVLQAPVLLTTHLGVLAVLLTIAGMATAPTLIIGISLAGRVVPRAQYNEGLMVVMTGLTIGVAAGAAVAGRVIERVGASEGYAVAVTSAALAAMVAAAAAPMLSRHTLPDRPAEDAPADPPGDGL